MNQNKSNNEVEFSIVDGGLFDEGLKRAGLNKPGVKFLGLRLAALVIVSWLPLLILSAKAGLILGNAVQIPFLHDFAVQARLLLAIPLLMIAEIVIAPKLRVVVRHFFTSGLVVEKDLSELCQLIADAVRRKESYIAELIILFIVIVQNTMRLEIVPHATLSTWHGVKSEEGMA